MPAPNESPLVLCPRCRRTMGRENLTTHLIANHYDWWKSQSARATFAQPRMARAEAKRLRRLAKRSDFNLGEKHAGEPDGAIPIEPMAPPVVDRQDSNTTLGDSKVDSDLEPWETKP